MGESLSPASKVTRLRGEETRVPGVQPVAAMISHISDQAMAAYFSPACLPVWFWSSARRIRPSSIITDTRLPPMTWVGVGQNEQPLSEVRPADFRRRDDARCNAIAHALKVAGDVLEAEGQMAGDVLEEAPGRRDLSDLVKAGWLTREGEGPSTQFRRTESPWTE